MELLTEAGVSRIVPWSSQRTVANWTGKSEVKRERWQRVARAAAMQSRRAYLPVVEAPGSPTGRAPVWCCMRMPGSRCSHSRRRRDRSQWWWVLKGGLAPEEVETLTGRGAVALNLGTLIMRTSHGRSGRLRGCGPQEQSVES